MENETTVFPIFFESVYDKCVINEKKERVREFCKRSYSTNIRKYTLWLAAGHFKKLKSRKYLVNEHLLSEFAYDENYEKLLPYDKDFYFSKKNPFPISKVKPYITANNKILTEETLSAEMKKDFEIETSSEIQFDKIESM